MKNLLPKEFRFSHQFSFLLHDFLAQIIVEGEKSKIFHTLINFESKKEADKFGTLRREEMMSWLLNYRKSDQYEIAFKQIILATLADFCHFVYEALRCSQKGKLTVTYSLLRKPLKDNLLVFEWLLAEPIDFLEKFHFGEPKDFDPSKVSPDRKKKIIEKAIGQTKQKIFKAETLYQLRYDRASNVSFVNLGDKATHLVTTFEKIKTETTNLNFIFLDEESLYSKWKHLYSWPPFLPYHALEIVESLVETFALRDSSKIDKTPDRCQIGFLLWAENIGHSGKLNRPVVIAKCPTCKEETSRGKNDLWDIYRKGFITCSKCKENIYMNDILTSDLYQKKIFQSN